MKKSLYWLIALMLCSCGEDIINKEDEGDDEGGGQSKTEIVGVVQKGAFIKGSQITVFALDKELSAMGESYPSQIKDNLGTFTISSLMKAEYVELRSAGYYYNETTGKVSESTISLQAVSSVKNTNINILTTLAYPRIKYLVGQGDDFNAATKKAEQEVLNAFGMTKNITGSFTDMNISGKNESDGVLLAISCLLQAQRTSSELSVLISDIASDLEKDGVLSQSLKEKIHFNETAIHLSTVINGLMNFYADKQINEYNIPPFYKYLDLDGDGVIDAKPIFMFLSEEQNNTEAYPATGKVCEYRVLSTEDFTVEKDNDWMELDKKQLASNVYKITCKLLSNNDKYRTGQIKILSGSNNVLGTISIKQMSSQQRIYLQLGNGAMGATAYGLQADEEVSVNGVTYQVKYDDNKGMCYVDVTSHEHYAVCYPVDVVSPGQDIYCCTVNYPAVVTGEESTPYYGLLVPSGEDGINNPAELNLRICSAALKINLSGEKASQVSKIELVGSSVLSGKIDYVVCKDLANPSYLPPEPNLSNISNHLELLNTIGRNTFMLMMYPHENEDLELVLYIGEQLYKHRLGSMNFDMGQMYTINVNVEGNETDIEEGDGWVTPWS